MTKHELIKKYERSIEQHKEEIDSLIGRLNKDKQVNVSVIANLIISHNNNIMQEELFLYHLEQLEFDSKSSKLQEENAIDKLGELEDIEDELGIDLTTLFKALKQKFVYNKVKIKIEILGLHIKSDELCLYGFVEDTTHAVYLSLKTYGNIWVLTKEELE